jgi:hypothetical protein
MEIFNEYRNKYYDVVYEIILSASNSSSKSISKKRIMEIIMKGNIISPEFQCAILNEYNEEQYNYHILKKIKDNEYTLSIDENVTTVPSALELSWLKYILQDRKSSLFIDDTLRDKLEGFLSRIDSPLKKQYINILDPIISDYINEAFINKLKLFKTAAELKKAIKYSYKNKNGTVLQKKISMPYRIEYSAKRDCFYGIMYSLNDNRPIKSIIKNLYDMEIVEVPDDLPNSSIFKSIEDKMVVEPLVLKIRDEENALERCFYIFSYYEKEAIYHSNKKIHELKVYYYKFEEEEVISKLLSLGKNVVVESPEGIRSKILYEINNSIENYL